MNYSIIATIYNKQVENPNEKDKNGNPVPPRYFQTVFGSSGFNLTTPTKEGTFTAAEIKAKIKEELKLSDKIENVLLKAKGKELKDSDAVTAYGVSYTAVILGDGVEPTPTPVVTPTPVPVAPSEPAPETPGTTA